MGGNAMGDHYDYSLGFLVVSAAGLADYVVRTSAVALFGLGNGSGATGKGPLI